MRTDVREKMQWSARIFRDVVWPTLGPRLGGGELIPMELMSNGCFRDLLDLHAGIDAWQIIHEQSRMRGLASRVQWTSDNGNGYPYDTFTVRTQSRCRVNTEIHKRLVALRQRDCNWLLPALTVQAYVDRNEKLCSCAVAHTRPLYRYIEERGIRFSDGRIWGKGLLREIENADGTAFVPIDWGDVREAGVRIIEISCW